MGVSMLHLGSRTFGSSVLTITPQPQDHSTKLTWLVKFPGAGVTTERTIQLSVSWKECLLLPHLNPNEKEILSSCSRCSKEPKDQCLSRRWHSHCSHLGKNFSKSGPVVEVVLVAVGEAAVKILAICLCLLFLR
ncbi:myeloid cell surface antigen CD33-like [Theropithecus gelada]|uniref:myeloid cell surface antigen CD33-like n=1 Tax=Theropithecus gelada TaxID=9565 RepID=UPI000DC177D5|nr:myeloid cell surface antigen CD33-like [Theropithecus gelada]